MYPSITCSGAPTIPKQQDNGKRPPEHRSGGLFLRSVPAVLLPVLLLPQLKLPLLFRFALCAGTDGAFLFELFALKLKRLLCLCADPGSFCLPVNQPLHALRIHGFRCAACRLNGWTEPQSVPVPEQECIYLVILWFRAERNFAGLILPVMLTFI